MDAMQCLLERRSIRKYLPQQIREEELDAVLKAATYAPTAKGTQSPLIVAVRDADDIAVMRKLNAQINGTDSDPFYGAPCVVVVFAEKGNPNGVQDASLVLGNMMNAAYAEGLGSCWINRARQTFELPEGKALMEKWGIGDGWEGVGNCILGYADCALPVPKERKAGYIVKIG